MSSVTLYNADCLDVLPTLAGVDAAVTDPPYGIGGSSGPINLRRGKGNYNSSFDDSPAYVASVIVPAVRQLIKMCACVVLTPGCKNFCIYPQPDSFGAFYSPAAIGLQRFGNADAQPIFYYGRNLLNRNVGVSCSYQMIELPEKNGHPCPKPLRTWLRLLKNVAPAGSTILDPFMGSGTTGVAAVRLGMNFIGIEIDPGYFAIAKQRIEAEQNRHPLFEQPERIIQPQLAGMA